MPLSNILRSRTLTNEELRYLKSRSPSFLRGYNMSEEDIMTIRNMVLPTGSRTTVLNELLGLDLQITYPTRPISSYEIFRTSEIRQVPETQEPTRTRPATREVQVEIGDSISDITRKYMHCYLLHDNDLWVVVGIVEEDSREGIKLDIFNFKRNIRIQIPYTSHTQFTHTLS